MYRLAVGSMVGPAILALSSPASAQGNVEVVVTNVRDGTGNLNVRLCTQADWLKTCPITASAPARAGTTIVIFRNVPPGRYGAIAYHDRNRNGKGDRNVIGMPAEDIGFSNNAMKRLAAPRYADAAFDHGAADRQITFAMKRF